MGRDCLDAETLAAWADGALNAGEREGAEAHAANCARCQAMMAAMVRTEPASAAPVSSPSRSRALWWIAALAPVAAAVVVWFAVPNRAPVQQSQSAEAISEAQSHQSQSPSQLQSQPPSQSPTDVGAPAGRNRRAVGGPRAGS